MDTNQSIDKTINCICDWIQQELKSSELSASVNNRNEIAEMTKALAVLISARADSI